MKEAIVHPDLSVNIIDSPIPTPNDDQVLIKVVYSGTNPKDWKVPIWRQEEANSGDDIAGIIESVGANVTEFRAGDRVAAFHEMMVSVNLSERSDEILTQGQSPHGSFAEYAIAWSHTTFHLPKSTSFEEVRFMISLFFTSSYVEVAVLVFRGGSLTQLDVCLHPRWLLSASTLTNASQL